jgi:hypothetical protein
MDGFEGPAKTTETDDGFGNVMVRGQNTKAYNCYFRETSQVDHSPRYDGTIDIPDTKYNREKIAAHVRGGDLRVVDRNLERQILAENKPAALKAKEAAVNNTPEMPEDFDGTKVVLRGAGAVKDNDPIEDPHAQDAEFTEVSKETAAAAEESEPEEKPRATSAAEVKAGAVAPKATKPLTGTNPKAIKAAEDMVPDVTEKTA